MKWSEQHHAPQEGTMTSTPKKSSLRAAHTAKTKRHAQRTPLPPKGSAGEGNPTVETLKDEVASSKMLKAKSRGKKVVVPAPADLENGPSEDDVPADLDVRSSGGDALAADVKSRRDAGATWREIAEALALGEGKTGTSRARRLYRQANDGASAPRKEPKQRTRRPYTGPMDDTTEGDGRALRGSRAASTPKATLDRYRLRARDERSKAERGRKAKMGDVNTAEVGAQQVSGLRRVFEGDGYTVVVEKQQADGSWLPVERV
jgi:hypothetical protein